MAKTNPAQQRLKRLANNHKCYLGGARRILWAPEFPLFLNVPGFWDPGTYLELKLDSLLTYALLEDGKELPWTAGTRHWQPNALTTQFAAPSLTIVESKSVTLDDAFHSELEITNRASKARQLDLVLWGRINATDVGEVTFAPVTASRDGIEGHYRIHNEAAGREHELRLNWSLRESGGRPTACTSYAVQNSEMTGETPEWRLTPFYELFDERLPNECNYKGGIDHRQGGQVHGKWVFVALHRRLRLGPRASVQVAGACQVSSVKTPARSAPALTDWESFFAAAPEFRCSDPFIEKYYDYRWYGLRLNAIDYGRAPLRHPCVFEGINPGWFRHAISYSSQVLAKECRWLHDPALARGCVLTFLDCQQDDGFVPGAVMPEMAKLHPADLMYHSDWGGAVRAVHEVHPDQEFLRRCYRGFGRYVDWFDARRDADGTGLYDVCSQAETGQEYMSRYLFVDPKADEWGQFRLKGVDATVYIYRLKRALAWMAAELGKPAEARTWNQRAEQTCNAVRTKMWDPKQRKFCDLDPRDGRRSPVKALTDFFPFLSDIATRQHVPAIYEHLLNPEEFWTEWPAPATSLDDALADPHGRWRGKRMCCPWNGRTWLMTNSHIADVLANAALTLDVQLEAYAVTFITRFIHMLFVDGDLDRPTSYEYYNPLTGQAPFFRATDDYMHSYIVDLILRHVVGLRPQVNGGLLIEPLQFGLDHFSLRNCVVAGKRVEVHWDGEHLRASFGRATRRVTGWGRLLFEPAS